MMLDREKHTISRSMAEICSIDALVPPYHLVRALDAAVDWGSIYNAVEPLYSADTGRPSIDPVVLIKIALLQHIFHLRSLRQTVAEIEINLAYRWFIGYSLLEKIPHFSTVSVNFVHRITGEVFDILFADVLDEVISSCGLPPESVIYESAYLRRGASYDRLINKYISDEALIQLTFDTIPYPTSSAPEDPHPPISNSPLEALYTPDELEKSQISIDF